MASVSGSSPAPVPEETARLLREYADRYETAAFIDGDPSWFMHQVSGTGNQEVMAFIASALSYGSRTQFLPKIGWLLDQSAGEPDRWVRDGGFRSVLAPGDSACFYRLYTRGTMATFLATFQELLLRHGSLGSFIASLGTDPCRVSGTGSVSCSGSGQVPDTGSVSCTGSSEGPGITALSAVEAFCRFFSAEAPSPVIPKDATSACKRVCMFLRWMVRDNSPVDLGLWSGLIDKRTLIIPLDTHVLTEASRLGLLSVRASAPSASMSAARRLTATLATVFPEDPLKGDFALFGYGVNH